MYHNCKSIMQDVFVKIICTEKYNDIIIVLKNIMFLYMYFCDIICICFMYSLLNIFWIYITFICILRLLYSLIIFCLIPVFL